VSVNRKISLIVQPGDSFFPIVKSIDEAQESIKITIFRMDDPVIQRALLDAHGRGVKVRALVAANPRGWHKKNRQLLKELSKAGIETNVPAGDTPKARYHYKILVTDKRHSLILTFNPTQENLHYTRDYGISLYDDGVASELDQLFEADWSGSEFEPRTGSPLVISPFNSREKLTRLLGSAKRSILISDAKLRDHQILNLLMHKASEGVDVRILGRDKYHGEVLSILKFREVTRFKLHAKAAIVDNAIAFIGSMNFRFENLDKRREVGIIVDDEEVVRKMGEVFASDWEQKTTSSHSQTMVLNINEHVEIASTTALYTLISRCDALTRFPLKIGETTIGRADDNYVVVSHPAVSRYHALLTIQDDDKCIVTDLSSQNGTFLNGELVQGNAEVVSGDVIGIGGADEFRFIRL
jgi:phosphatidylserine/phosphatidylglycerophosphate/cardiolipin synthase-like enzyme